MKDRTFEYGEHYVKAINEYIDWLRFKVEYPEIEQLSPDMIRYYDHTINRLAKRRIWTEAMMLNGKMVK